jgi:hypothetical protein
MIKILEEISKKFKTPSEVSVTQTEVNTVTGDYKKETLKFVQEVYATSIKKKHNNVILLAITY